MFDRLTKVAGLVTAAFAAVGGGYTMSDKLGFLERENPILTWSSENFSISSGPVNGEFKVIVAREKHRDDCKIESFEIEIRDADYIVHPAKSSVTKFSGPASEKIDKFGYTFVLTGTHLNHVNIGTATLMGRIDYECPEGEVLIVYPSHEKLNFEILSYDNSIDDPRNNKFYHR